MNRFVKIIFYMLIPLSVSGQITGVSDQYILNPIIINPAYAGNRGALNISAFYRKQWVGIAGAPETVTLAADAHLLDGKLGLGTILINDKIGVTKQTYFKSVYSYKIRMGKGNLSFGLGAGLMATNTRWSDLIALDPGDDFYLVDSRVFIVPDFSFGLYYTHQKYFAGLSIPKLLNYKFNFKMNRYSLSENSGQLFYLFNTGYAFDISAKTKFLPSTLLYYYQGKNILFDINSIFSFFDKFWVGISYKNNRSVAGLFQLRVIDQFKIAYTYNFELNKLRSYSAGTHEIMLRYEFRYKVNINNSLIF
jgi:type IX secretion system PorP/SprF family membrane protein